MLHSEIKDEKCAEWSISEVSTCPLSRTHLLSPTNIVLEYVKSVNVEILTRCGRHLERISLREVPKFLVDAFENLEHKEALTVDGIFRKEGNSTRLKNAWTIYCGMSTIPEEYTAHDVCSLIKRFFREIKSPIFEDCQLNILKFAESLNNDDTIFRAILAVIERLPATNISAVTFLLKQLKKISEYSNENHMTIDNLATVFAPSLFRDDTPISISKKKKSKDDQFHLMKFVRSRNTLQISVLKLLITKSHILSPLFEVRVSRLSSEHCNNSSKKSINGYNTPTTAANLPSLPLEITTPAENKMVTCAASFKRQPSAKVNIQRVLSLRERPRNVNLTNNCIRYTTSVWHQKPRIASALIARDVINNEKKSGILDSVLTSQSHNENVSTPISRIPLIQKKIALNDALSSTNNFIDGKISDIDDDVERTKSIGEEDLFIVQSLRSAKPRPPRPSPPKIVVGTSVPFGEYKMKSEIQAKKYPHQKQPITLRKSREYVSENEKICTYCDARGHLIKNCPNLEPWK